MKTKMAYLFWGTPLLLREEKDHGEKGGAKPRGRSARHFCENGRAGNKNTEARILQKRIVHNLFIDFSYLACYNTNVLNTDAPLAQLVEQLTLNQWVQGSSPWRCTTSFFLFRANPEKKMKCKLRFTKQEKREPAFSTLVSYLLIFLLSSVGRAPDC